MPVSSATTTVAPAAPPAARTRPAWQRDPVFRLFASAKMAVVLLVVLIVASIAGTLYETTFDAKVARAYIYNAWWFNGWLTLLCVNLACAAFSRWPWKRHHTGFLITHLGIITLLIGAMIGRRWGIEGTMTLHKGEPPNNQLVVDQRVLRLQEGDNGEIRQYPVEIIGRRPTPAKPWTLGRSSARGCGGQQGVDDAGETGLPGRLAEAEHALELATVEPAVGGGAWRGWGSRPW